MPDEPNLQPPAPGGTQNQSPPPNQSPPQNQPPINQPPPKGSIYDDLGIDDPAKSGKTTLWPDDWRTQMAGDAKDAGERLKRFESPAALAKSYMALEQRLRSGEYKRAAPPPDPTTDEAGYTKWREEQGLPVKAEEYNIVPDGVKIDDLDPAGKESLAKFQGAFHKINLSQDQAKGVTGAVYEMALEQMAQQAQGDARDMNSTEDTLRADWGNEFRNNVVMNKAHINKAFGEEIGEVFFDARLPNGQRLGNIPAISKAINDWARAEGGDVLVDAGGGGATSIDTRIAEIEKMMTTDMNKYTTVIAEEYSKLLEKREARKR